MKAIHAKNYKDNYDKDDVSIHTADDALLCKSCNALQLYPGSKMDFYCFILYTGKKRATSSWLHEILQRTEFR